ncbi:MAG: hypothetical protein IPK13_21620 [Deltaproteobacteria bacterium]|nr:hypothetical protein [Deltaproteobacteria bacterium]
MTTIEAIASDEQLPVAVLCEALAAPRSSLYRRRTPKPEPKARPTPARALAPDERAAVLDVLHSEPQRRS